MRLYKKQTEIDCVRDQTWKSLVQQDSGQMQYLANQETPINHSPRLLCHLTDDDGVFCFISIDTVQKNAQSNFFAPVFFKLNCIQPFVIHDCIGISYSALLDIAWGVFVSIKSDNYCKNYFPWKAESSTKMYQMKNVAIESRPGNVSFRFN